ncbi:Uu.00g136960.m01.CDS01 [Anthostomella pinea]|uniref:Uu.00g136960.m01.CDS01 n=1 Tax=Anthostomella pinea TaxID=933095 RepID=A0AAI8YIM9_9PEZI|nr:Uu.00g136960.m01.CDS01 [Anthostomella pinea]
MDRITAADVKALELTCPKFSATDAQSLQSRLQSGEILQSFNSEEHKGIYKNLLAIDCPIPSLYTFFKDAKYLESCAESMRLVIGLSGRSNQTVDAALWDSFQQNRDEFRQREERLWLYVAQNYPDLSQPTHKKNILAKAQTEKAKEVVLYGVAMEAYKQGFENERINELRSRVLGPAAADDELPRSDMPRTTNMRADEVERKRRYGFPSETQHHHDKHLIVLENIRAGNSSDTRVTSFFIQKSVLLAFFAKESNDNHEGVTQSVYSHTAYPLHRPSGHNDLYESISSLVRRRDEQSAYEEASFVDWMDASQYEDSQQQDQPLLPLNQSARPALDLPLEAPPIGGQSRYIGGSISTQKENVRFMTREMQEWNIVQQVANNATDVEAAAETLLISGLRAFSTTMQPLLPKECFAAAGLSRGNVLILLPEDDIHITRELAASALHLGD